MNYILDRIEIVLTKEAANDKQAQTLAQIFSDHMREHVAISLPVLGLETDTVVKEGTSRCVLMLQDATSWQNLIGQRLTINFLNAFLNVLTTRVAKGLFDTTQDTFGPAPELQEFFESPIIRLFTSDDVEITRIRLDESDSAFFDYRSDQPGHFARFQWVKSDLAVEVLDHDPFTPIPGL